MNIRVLAVMALSVFGLGCTQVISKDVLKEVNRNISFAELQEAPDRYQGQTVLLAGVVVNTTYEEEGTLLEIYQTDMDWEERPVHPDESAGRFLALYKGFLDSEIYKNGRKVTLAGIVKGLLSRKLGKFKYHYPFLLIREIYLWKKKKREVSDPYLWYPWGMWGPWTAWGPWYYPYWWY